MLDACADFSLDPSMVRLARRFVGQTLRLWEVPTDHLHDAVLLTSELLSNVVLHARSDARLTVQSNEQGAVRVEVLDDNPRLPTPSTPPEGAHSGHGLTLVEAIATAWGVDRTGDGKVVWFELGPFRSPDVEPDCFAVDSTPSVDEALDQIERDAAAGRDETASTT